MKSLSSSSFIASGWWYGRFWVLEPGLEMRWFSSALEALAELGRLW